MQSDALDNPALALTEARRRAGGENLHLDAGYLSARVMRQRMLALQQKSTEQLGIDRRCMNKINGRLPNIIVAMTGILGRQPSPLTQDTARLAPSQCNPFQAFARQMGQSLQGNWLDAIARLGQCPQHRHCALPQP
jgi:hypothetical protein